MPIDLAPPAIIKPAPKKLLRAASREKFGMLPLMIGLWGAPSVSTPAVLTYIGTPTPQEDNNTTYTFTNAAIGAAAADRLVVVVIQSSSDSVDAGNTTRTISSITIGGNAADLIVQAGGLTSGGFRALAGIAQLVVPTGTTATIAVTFSGAAYNCAVSVYTITGLQSTTPHDSEGAHTETPGSGAITVTPDAPANGVLIAGAVFGDNRTATWAGANEDYDAQLDFGRSTAAGVHELAQEAGRTVSATPSSSTDRKAIVAATWA